MNFMYCEVAFRTALKRLSKRRAAFVNSISRLARPGPDGPNPSPRVFATRRAFVEPTKLLRCCALRSQAEALVVNPGREPGKPLYRDPPATAALGADTQIAPAPNPAASATKRAKILTRDMACSLI